MDIPNCFQAGVIGAFRTSKVAEATTPKASDGARMPRQ